MKICITIEILVLINYINIHIWFLVCCVAWVLLHFVIIYFDARIKTSFIDLDPAAVLVAVAFFFYMLNSISLLGL